MKRGYIFSVDALIAIIIIISGFFLIFSNIEDPPEVAKAREVSHDIMSLLFDVKVRDICFGPQVTLDECECLYQSVEDLYCNDLIPDLDVSLLELFGGLYKKNPSLAQEQINEIINETITESKLIPKNYEYTFVLTDFTKTPPNMTTVYPIR